MKLTDFLQPECIKLPLEAGAKRQAITELIDLLNHHDLLLDYDKAYKAVMDRESVRSTGVGQGFAIPHAKTDAVDRLVMAMGRTAEPIDFESIDKKPVDLIVLLISPPDQTGLHIQALARISRLMTIPLIRPQITATQTAQELYEIIREHQ
ncbi:MAG: PTS sugar transporter subunit IIA [Sedimentisphaerales bacterium]|nr:PTS sugar transporter subunit IIA [Sedimentisphaerales bacterium]